MLKMRSLLSEAPGDAEDMVQKVASKDLAGSVSMLQKLSADPDVKDILNKGAEDGDVKDEVIPF